MGGLREEAKEAKKKSQAKKRRLNNPKLQQKYDEIINGSVKYKELSEFVDTYNKLRRKNQIGKRDEKLAQKIVKVANRKVSEKKIESEELLKASKKAFGEGKITQDNILDFKKKYSKMKAKGDLTERDRKAFKRISNTLKKLKEKGKIE